MSLVWVIGSKRGTLCQTDIFPFVKGVKPSEEHEDDPIWGVLDIGGEIKGEEESKEREMVKAIDCSEKSETVIVLT